jgi:hypothetical protein
MRVPFACGGNCNAHRGPRRPINAEYVTPVALRPCTPVLFRLTLFTDGGCGLFRSQTRHETYLCWFALQGVAHRTPDGRCFQEQQRRGCLNVSLEAVHPAVDIPVRYLVGTYRINSVKGDNRVVHIGYLNVGSAAEPMDCLGREVDCHAHRDWLRCAIGPVRYHSLTCERQGHRLCLGTQQ